MTDLHFSPLFEDVPDILTGPEYFIQFKDLLTLYHLRYTQGKPFVTCHVNSTGKYVRQFFVLEQTAQRKFRRYLSLGFYASLNPTLDERDFLKQKYESILEIHKTDLMPHWALSRLHENYSKEESQIDAILHWLAPWLNVHFYVLSLNPDNGMARFIVDRGKDGVFFVVERLGYIMNSKLKCGFSNDLTLEREVSFKPVNSLQLYYSLQSNSFINI
jgi:hypothetical protein